MDDIKRESSNKAKRSRCDQVNLVAITYLQRRNYPLLPCFKIPTKEFMLNSSIDNEISRPNSILYSCFNNDPTIIDHTFSKFLTWIRDFQKTKNKHDDLEFIVGPLFCHIYLEVLRGGHAERAANFFKVHLPSIDKSKCDNLVKNLISAFGNEAVDMPLLKDTFRSNKYKLQLSTDSVVLLKKFLAEAGHVLLLQVFQSWFTIEEKQEEEEQEESAETKNECGKDNQSLHNGHVENTQQKLSVQKLLDAVEALKTDLAPIYSVNITNIKDEVTCGVLSRPNGLFAYSYNNSINLRSLETLQQLDNTSCFGEVVLLGHSARIYDIIISNEHLISASQDKTIRLFDLEDYTQKTVYKGHEYPVYCLTMNNNGTYFASGSYDYSGRLWSLTRKHTIRVFIGHTQEVTSINFHSNCTYLATGSADKNIRMWSIKDAEPIRLLLGSKGAVYCVCFSPNGQYLASSGEDRRLRIWDLTSAKQLIELKTGSQPVIKLAISDDESTIATGCVDGTVKTWNFKSLVKRGNENNSLEPIHNIGLMPKLLSLEYCFETFGCLTAQNNASVLI